MPTVPHPTQGVTTCNRCGARIRWATGTNGTIRGRRIPLNALPSPAGGLAARTTGLGGLVVRELDAEFPDAQDERLEWKAIAHWDSCTGNSQLSTPPPAAPRSRPARRRPIVQPPLWGQSQGRNFR